MKPRKRSLLLFLMMYLTFVLVLFFQNNNNSIIVSQLKAIESDPPSVGDWIITDSITRSNETIKLNGSIVIEENGFLNLTSVTIIFMLKNRSVNNGTFNLTIREGGTFVMQSASKITTDDLQYLSFIHIMENSITSFKDSIFENIGYNGGHPSIRVDKASALFSGCTFASTLNTLPTISLYNTSDVEIKNNIILSDQGSGIYSQFCQDLIISNNQISTHLNGIYVDDFQSPHLYIANNRVRSEKDTGCVIVGDLNDDLLGIPLIKENLIEGAVNQGIYIENLQNLKLISNQITNIKSNSGNYGSVHLLKSDNSIIVDNYISNSYNDGLALEHCNNSTVFLNTILWSNISLYDASGINSTECNNLKIVSNTISSIGGDGIHYKALEGENVNISSNVISSINRNAIFVQGLKSGQITSNQIKNIQSFAINIYNSSNFDIKSNSITESHSIAIYAKEAIDFNVTNNNIQKIQNSSLYLLNSKNIHIESNRFYENYHGIFFDASSFSTVINNYFRNLFEFGLYLNSTSHNNSIIKNIIFHNSYGIYCEGYYNTFTNNTIQSNIFGALMSINSQLNLLYNNDFIKNNIQASDFGNNNIWSSIPPLPEYYYGNYWSDYQGEDQLEPFGFGDLPYNISLNSADFYPIMEIVNYYPPPNIDHPYDLSYFESTTGNTLIWHPSTTLPPYKYTIECDGEIVFSGIWSGSTIIFSVDSLSLGDHTIICTVYDLLEQSAVDMVVVSVVMKPTEPTSTVDQKTTLFTMITNEILLIVLSLIIALVITIIIAKT